ncbi:hypothetical protein [Paenibacillus sp. DCT19]|uniref:hypothetical protein n=1 Tax=Paenibacillus sp. DCT19 TaxID=2211212 RepID=UPI000FE21CCD|nr:hypothetical protein [Paenibacillus sp. DCT19]
MPEKVNYGSSVCMQFSNEELYKYFITKFENNSSIAIRTLSQDDREIEITSSTPIQFICFDGEKQDLFISFNGDQTSIFVHDEEIMFIDENKKGMYTTSDTFGNVVYEGICGVFHMSSCYLYFAMFFYVLLGQKRLK